MKEILEHKRKIQENILKSFGVEISVNNIEKSQEDEINPFEMETYKSELTKAELDKFEKAKHQDGDMHPNGKWVWRQSANVGKGDWRVAKPGVSKSTTGGGTDKTTNTSADNAKKTPNVKKEVDKNKELTNEQKSKITPFNNPEIYIELSKNSQEKKDLIALLKDVGTVEEEKTAETGIYGKYKVGNEYISVAGTSVTTGMKKTKTKARYLGMSGHKRWYGGSTSIAVSDKSEKFTVFDDAKMSDLIKRLNKKKK